MWLRLVTMTILLAFASRTCGRPSDPDLSGDIVAGTTVPTLSDEGKDSFNSRYMSKPTATPIKLFRNALNLSNNFKSQNNVNKIQPILRSLQRSRRNSDLSFSGVNNNRNHVTFGGFPVTVGPHILEELSTNPPDAKITQFRSFSTDPKHLLTSGPGYSPAKIAPILPSIRPQSTGEISARSFDDSKDSPASLRTRNYVRITPQKLRPGFNIRNKNSTYKKPPILTDDLKNWPNEAIQNVQDFFNYDKYVSSIEEEYKTKPPKHKSPGSNEPVKWTKVPVVSLDEKSPDVKIIKPTTHLVVAGNKTKHPVTSQVAQSTVVHILNTGSKKTPNVTVLKAPGSTIAPTVISHSNHRPPQNVHIMFMVDDKDAGNINHKVEDLPPLSITGTDKDCPTVVINSITQINNTIESKEGCNDLNIVINSHLLQNTKKAKPASNGPKPSMQLGTTQILKDPPGPVYGSHQTTTNFGKPGSVKNPQIITADNFRPAESDQVSTLELFQNTHINVLTSPEEPASQSTAPETANDYDDEEEIANDAEGSELEAVAPQGASSGIQAPNLPGNVAAPASQLAAQTASGGGDTAVAPVDEEDDDDEDDTFGLGYTAAGLLDSMASVYSQFSELNPINYGIFGMAVAPFVAFAAGVVGVATFLFPWAFPGSIEVSRSFPIIDAPLVYRPTYQTNRDNSKKVVKRSAFRDLHESTLNEWKYRRRKRRVNR